MFIYILAIVNQFPLENIYFIDLHLNLDRKKIVIFKKKLIQNSKPCFFLYIHLYMLYMK